MSMLAEDLDDIGLEILVSEQPHSEIVMWGTISSVLIASRA
jgi:hypothetical protein